LTRIAWHASKHFKFGLASNFMVIQHEQVPGRLDLAVCTVPAVPLSLRNVRLLGPVSAACASEGIRRDTGIISWLHWPNLVTIDGLVVAKTSLSWAGPPESEGRARVMFGISVNCFADVLTAFPTGLPATSILEALRVEIDVDLLRDKILHALDWYYAEWERGMHLKLVERMQPTIAWLGLVVEVSTSDGQVLRGRAKGLDELGSLLLEQLDGRARQKTRTIPADTVELVRAVN